MKEEIDNEAKSVENIKDQPKKLDRPWELSAEDQNFFDRKIKALAYFKEKLDSTKDQSSKSSQEVVASLTRRIDALDTRANPEEINTIIERLNNLEKQKQEIIKSGESQVENVAEAEYVGSEEVETKDNSKIQKQPEVTENNKPENETAETRINTQDEKSTETSKEKSLEPGDEIFVNGKFYKVYGFVEESENEKELSRELSKEHEDRKVAYRGHFEEGKSFQGLDEGEKSKLAYVAGRKKELKETGTMPPRKIKALLEGSDAFEEFSENDIVKVTTSEQREKLLEMQKDFQSGEQKAADYMGMGAAQKAVHKLTSQE